MTRTAREQSILRIPLDGLRAGLRLLAIGGACDDKLLHRLDIPTRSYKLCREPIEEVRVRWRIALDAEIFGGFHQSGAKVHLPEAVDGHARGKRVRRIDEPFRKSETIVWSAVSKRIQYLRNSWLHS